MPDGFSGGARVVADDFLQDQFRDRHAADARRFELEAADAVAGLAARRSPSPAAVRSGSSSDRAGWSDSSLSAPRRGRRRRGRSDAPGPRIVTDGSTTPVGSCDWASNTRYELTSFSVTMVRCPAFVGRLGVGVDAGDLLLERGRVASEARTSARGAAASSASPQSAARIDTPRGCVTSVFYRCRPTSLAGL